MSDSTSRSGVRLDGTLNLGHALTISTLIIGFTSWLLTNQGRVDQTAREVQGLREQVAEQANTTRDSLRESTTRIEGAIAGVQAQIRDVPSMNERLKQVEAELGRVRERGDTLDARIDARRTSVDTRLDELRRVSIELQARMDALSRASGLNLPGAPGVRPR